MNHGHVTLLAIRFMEKFQPLDLTVLLDIFLLRAYAEKAKFKHVVDIWV